MSGGICGKQAAVRYTWPGRDEAVACVDCAKRLQAVAAAIDLPLQFIPLGASASGPIVTDWPTCPQPLGEEVAS